jgi:hypothetical protein
MPLPACSNTVTVHVALMGRRGRRRCHNTPLAPYLLPVPTHSPLCILVPPMRTLHVTAGSRAWQPPYSSGPRASSASATRPPATLGGARWCRGQWFREGTSPVSASTNTAARHPLRPLRDQGTQYGRYLCSRRGVRRGQAPSRTPALGCPPPVGMSPSEGSGRCPESTTPPCLRVCVCVCQWCRKAVRQ